jgi:hypothetical protein
MVSHFLCVSIVDDIVVVDFQGKTPLKDSDVLERECVKSTGAGTSIINKHFSNPQQCLVVRPILAPQNSDWPPHYRNLLGHKFASRLKRLSDMWHFVLLPHSALFYTNRLHINLLAPCGRHTHFRSPSNPCNYPSSFPFHLIYLTIRMVTALSEGPRP